MASVKGHEAKHFHALKMVENTSPVVQVTFATLLLFSVLLCYVAVSLISQLSTGKNNNNLVTSETGACSFLGQYFPFAPSENMGYFVRGVQDCLQTSAPPFGLTSN